MTHLFGQLHQKVTAAHRVLLVAHKKPDGDTLGSSSSVLNWLLREGKDVTAYCRDLPPQAFRYIDNIHRYTNDPSVFEKPYDVVIVFDSSNAAYCGIDEYLPKLPEGYFLVNLDHHASNNNFAHLNIVITDASSTAEVVYRWYESMNVHIDHKMATSLLTGMITDTTDFTNAATNVRTMDAAGKLVSAGGRITDIHKNLLHDKTFASLKIWGLILSRVNYNPTFDAATTYLKLADTTDISTDIIEGVSNFLGATLKDAEVVLFLRELPGNQVKGSFRSATQNILPRAEAFGGGGHKKAAGFTVPGRLEETKEGVKISL